jgi:uncharacterized glyoxalase superfamily protein PhnB
MNSQPEQPPSINRSMPPSVVIPELAYPDVGEAANWLCQAFGFVERLRIGDHRAQLWFGEGSVIVTKLPDNQGASFIETVFNHSVMVRVDDIDKHYERAKQAGTRIVNLPTDYPYGERQYTVDDPGAHRWTFSQTIADVDPEDWGGTLLK